MNSYMKEFGFTIADRPISVDDVRVRCSGKSGIGTTAMTQTGGRAPKPTRVRNQTGNNYLYFSFLESFDFIFLLR